MTDPWTDHDITSCALWPQLVSHVVTSEAASFGHAFDWIYNRFDSHLTPICYMFLLIIIVFLPLLHSIISFSFIHSQIQAHSHTHTHPPPTHTHTHVCACAQRYVKMKVHGRTEFLLLIAFIYLFYIYFIINCSDRVYLIYILTNSMFNQCSKAKCYLFDHKCNWIFYIWHFTPLF